MLKSILLAAAISCVMSSIAQKTDTLVLYYKPDQYILSNSDKDKINHFLTLGFDRILINGYTDETEGDTYNLDLSRKRSEQVHIYLKSKKLNGTSLFSQFFGETVAATENPSDEIRARDRRTVIIGYRYPRVTYKPTADPMKPVTTTLDNGFIVTYRPGASSRQINEAFSSNSGSVFRFITNTSQMRENNIYNNTTRGEILSSVLIFCNQGLNPCKLDSPILIRVPIPFQVNCSVAKIKFFNAVAERGRRIWQEQTKDLYPEVINGQQYIRLWMDDFCECINFDIKIDPECFDIDSTKVFYVNANIKSVTTELLGLNSLYIPKKVGTNSYSITYIKNQLNNARVSFTVYDGKKRVRTFRNQKLSTLPYDSVGQQYLVKLGSYKFYFPKQRVQDVVLKVNNEKYKTFPLKRKYDFVYLNRNTEDIRVDFAIMEKGRIVQYLDQPLSSLPYNEATGYYTIDKKFLKAKKQEEGISKISNF